ncbi:MAG: hypothetical protein HZA53_09865 [Planctomycetes bacterium]|nr:hypothetical protein [Planctomycetota bacterium]
MKRVFRSCLDPLPRFLSTRGLIAVVLIVVTGTALSVHEYLQSGREPERAWPSSTVRASERTPKGGSTQGQCTRNLPGAACDGDQHGAASGARPCGAEERSEPATLYRPDESTATGT